AAAAAYFVGNLHADAADGTEAAVRAAQLRGRRASDGVPLLRELLPELGEPPPRNPPPVRRRLSPTARRRRHRRRRQRGVWQTAAPRACLLRSLRSCIAL